MRKFILGLIISFAIVSPSFAGLLGSSMPVETSSGASTFSIGTSETIYSNSFPMHNSDVFGLFAIASSATASATDITIELQESYTTPATEGSEDTNYVEPDGISDVLAITDELAHIVVLSPVPMPRGRYKITGSASNPDDATLTLYNFMQGEN